MIWTHHAIIVAFLLAVGAAVGSFLNVCIYRIPARINLLWPPSHCPGCGSAIAARDNVPILGWLAFGAAVGRADDRSRRDIPWSRL